LIDNIFIQFGELVFQQPISILVSTNYAPLLADLFLYANGEEYLQVLLKNTEKKLAQTLNSRFQNIDDVLSLTNALFCDYLHIIYIHNLTVKDTADTQVCFLP